MSGTVGSNPTLSSIFYGVLILVKKTFLYNKLIRDLTYKKIVKESIDHKVLPCDDTQLIKHFKDKLKEETDEVADACNEANLKEELADVVEVIHGFVHAMGLSFEDIEKERLKKLKIRGGFKKGIFMHCVTFDINHPTTQYCLEHSEKYPEIVYPEEK